MFKAVVKRVSRLNAKSYLNKVVQGTIEDVTVILTKEAKKEAPVRTGYLRASIKNRVDKMKAWVRAFAPYAKYVEYGTMYQSSNPFFRRAVDTVKRKMPSILRKNWRKYGK